MRATATLPIEPVLPLVTEALNSRKSAVLVAPPGSGKTTYVPLSLLKQSWAVGRRILLLEPRRLAVRSVAHYMAQTLGERVGQTVGYRMRLDTRVGPHTCLEVITEGILTRLLQSDPTLQGVALVIFDEFHERSLDADLGLAFCLHSREILQEDLRVLIMSATLEAQSVAHLLGNAPVIIGESHSYPVKTHYLPVREEGPIEQRVAKAILTALSSTQGDILAFLPGVGEIRGVEQCLMNAKLARNVRVAPLYGNLSPLDQDSAIAPSKIGERKVVLATAIAETSLTVEGIEVVIDSGLARIPRFSPRTGLTRLETVTVSQSSADQRRGRAGRLAPGVCYRLWTEQEHRNLLPRTTPEILSADLTPLALELAAWGVRDVTELCWLDLPPAAALAEARQLLMSLGALNEGGSITPYGRSLTTLAVHPRLAHMILQAFSLGLGGLACELAALVSERDILRSDRNEANADLRLRVEALQYAKDNPNRPFSFQGCVVDNATCQRVLSAAQRWRRQLGLSADELIDAEDAGLLLAFAYPDRIGQQRPGGNFLLRNGRGAQFHRLEPLAEASYIVATDLDDRGRESRIFLAAPLGLLDLEKHFASELVDTSVVWFDSNAQAVKASKRMQLGALVIKQIPVAQPDPASVLTALLQGIAQKGLAALPWTRAARQMQERIIFMNCHQAGWPDVADAALSNNLSEVLGPHLFGMKSLEEVRRLDLKQVLLGMLSWDQHRSLDEQAPTHILVPSGSRIPVDYSQPAAPSISVRLQQVFGWRNTPCIGGGKVPLTMHLLSPAQRPVQVTQDLASFWQKGYFEVRKELKGRYPKHYWPDDPLTANPTNRTRSQDS